MEVYSKEDVHTFELPGDDDSRYLRDMMAAILEVRPWYFIRCTYDDSHEAIDQLERVFAYELYHQWSKFVEQYQKEGDTNICLNGEAMKPLRGQNKQPDMILHEYNTDRQEIVVEIKRRKYTKGENIADDIKKLAIYTTGEDGTRKILHGIEPYKVGVFILTLKTMDNLTELIAEVENKFSIHHDEFCIDKHSIRKVHCICIPEPGIIQYAPLTEIIGKIKS